MIMISPFRLSIRRQYVSSLIRNGCSRTREPKESEAGSEHVAKSREATKPQFGFKCSRVCQGTGEGGGIHVTALGSERKEG